MRCGAVFCFLIVCVELAQFADGLKASEKGVCVSKHTIVKTRPKTVLVALSKWCGKKKCTAKQTRQQKYSVITNRLMCCKGFMYIAQNESCAPVCSTGCLNGTCTDPEVCHCAPPTYLDPVTKNKCLTPVCDHPCINGQCTPNNTCTCLKNFTVFNATHCIPNCTEDYELNSSLSCAPKCDNCTNGRCTAPNTCACNPGYTLDGICKPECTSKCINGLCVAPDICKCLDGFVANGTDSKDCIPKCDICDNGRCVTPNVCACKEGYAMVNGSCQPVCKENCVNGRCIEPDVCACDEGFQKKNATYCYQPCGECRPDGTCLLNKTETNYKTVTSIETYSCKSRRTCSRHVRRRVPYEVDKPIVMCCDDYEYDEKAFICKPLCLDGCIGGNCTAPHVCTCEPPLILEKNRCVAPTCDQPCVHGDCTANNTCTCHDGYSLKGNNFTCVAQCTNCVNGNCEAPNVCICNDGYFMKDGKCEPECKNCTNGFCDEPNICKCSVKYEMHHGTCQAVCETPCVNARCVSPNTCECFKGYEKGDRKEVCEAKCDSCIHGDCVAPNECRCHKGYAVMDGVCSPVCRETCVNGNCSAPNECSCKEGYIQNVTNPYVCYRPCGECNFGTCNLDGECICEDGYELVNGTCSLLTPPVVAGIASTPGLAGLEVTWLVGGAVGLLLVILVIVAIDRSWRRRKDFGQKTVDKDQPYGSVVYTLPDTLIRNNDETRNGDDIPELDEEGATETLMPKDNNMV